MGSEAADSANPKAGLLSDSLGETTGEDMRELASGF